MNCKSNFVLFLICGLLPCMALQAQLHGFSTKRPMPPSGWPSLDWEAKRKILFGMYSPCDQEIELIKQAMPSALADAETTTRKVLVFYRCKYPHVSIATGTKTFDLMGELTGAFEATLSDDPADFRPDNLAQYDAVLLNNTTSFDSTIGLDGQSALMDYVRSGKGLIGIHAAADSCKQWEEGATLLGGVFAGHPWTSKGTWQFRVEAPDHPLNAAFANEEFTLTDEVYQYKDFSLDRSKVLVSLDLTHDRNKQGPHYKQEALSKTVQGSSHPVAWIHSFGKGRVFYSNLGHNPSTYWSPEVLKHYLDGIRYATGDLDTSDTDAISAGTDDKTNQ